MVPDCSRREVSATNGGSAGPHLLRLMKTLLLPVTGTLAVFLLALAVFMLMPTILRVMGGGELTLSEFHRLVGSGVLDLAGIVLMGIVIVVVAALCVLTSRWGVFRILNSRP